MCQNTRCLCKIDKPHASCLSTALVVVLLVSRAAINTKPPSHLWSAPSMSAATPAPSNPPSEASSQQEPANQEPPTQSGSTDTDQLVIEYLHQRGHKNAERALRDALGLPSPPTEDDTATSQPTQPTVSDAELRKHLVPFWQKRDKPGENALVDGKVTMKSLSSGGVTTPSVSQLLESINPGGADEILSLDPTDRHEGFRDLEVWVEGSLNMYQVSSHAGLPFLDLQSQILSCSQSSGRFCTRSSAISIST